MNQTTQLLITAVSTIIASGAVWQLLKVRADITSIKATARKVEEEAIDLEVKRTREAAEYYYALWRRCEEGGGGEHPPPPPPPSRKRI